ncbi:MAG: hydroxymethylpyrimidine/phosphomethylpyrimidine kinase [Gammaproteobacteria bacterium]|nr:hydroxymethylpyrimidine/phosphomethylpyrimidine kinase [Gammaproteobacteria bacterium]
MTTSNPPVVLCFSGADPTGGAGIQADIETMCSHGCIAASVITVATVQDTVNVHSFSPMPSDLIIEQARAVLEDMPIAAIKIGVVGSAEVAMAIYSIITDYPEIPVIYDPVLSTEKNAALSTEDVVETVRTLLLPVTKILTPNIHEVHALAPGSDTPAAAAMGLLETDVEYILLTGTHGKTPDVVHTLFSNNRELETFHNERLPHKYHGSGCTLAASIAAQIALGQEVLGAVRKALDYTHKTLVHANRIGMGQYHPNRFFWDKN